MKTYRLKARRKRIIVRWSALALLAALLPASHAQFAPTKVTRIEIKHVGPANVSDDLVTANIRVKVGEIFTPASVDEDVRNLYATGLFYNIRVNSDTTADGVALTYVVQAKPRLTEIRFSGNKKYSDSKLRKKVSSKVSEPLDERKLFTDTQEVQKMYQKAGYPRTKVKYTLNIDEMAGRGTATIEIEEGSKIKIEDVEFVGADAFKQGKLRGVLKKTRRWWMFSWLTGNGYFKEAEFDEDRDRVNEYYRDHGYIDFDITEVKQEPVAGKGMVVKIFVSEGAPYKVGAVKLTDAPMFPTNQVNKLLKLSPGATFTPKEFTKDLERIEDFYGARGHIDVKAGTENFQPRKVPNTVAGTMDLDYTIKEGQKSYIEKIEIRGNTKTKDKVIRRELAVAPGETFDMVKVKLSKQRLEGLNYFEKVDTRSEESIASNRRNLAVSVEEKNTGNFSVGAGFSSVDNLVGFAEMSQGNFDLANPPTFTGGGQKMRLRLQLGTERTDILASFVEPWFLGRKLSLGVDAYHRNWQFQSVNNLYNEIRTGARVSLTRALWNDFTIGTLSYTLEDVGIVDIDQGAPPSIWAEDGHSLLSRVGGSLAYDTRNSVFLPDKGQRTEVFSEVVSGDRQFYKLELRSGWYFRGFVKGHVLELIGRVGVTDSLKTEATVPFYDRYYLGGITSLRGYKYRDVGVKEPSASGEMEAVGGGTYWTASAEYSIPIIERLRLATFYDVGMVYQDAYSFSDTYTVNTSYGGVARSRTYSTGTYADNFGFGLRLNLPIGPLRLDYGIPMTHDANTSGSGRFQFSVGYTRDF